METDVLDLIEASIDGTADKISVKMRAGASTCVILASAGYPASAQKDVVIHGLAEHPPAGVEIFHSGTARNTAGETVTAGGRVLGVTAQAENLRRASGKAYDALAAVSFQGMQYRRDIGWRALGRERI